MSNELSRFEPTIKEFSEAVAPVFEQNKWAWINADGTDYIPDVHQIEHRVRDLLRHVLQKRPIGGVNEYSRRMGRITVSINTFGEVYFGLTWGWL